MSGFSVSVCDPRFGAKGDGKNNDRAAIQAAIDYVFMCGGGTVSLDCGKTFASTGSIVIKSGVELHFEDSAKLKQCSGITDYYKPTVEGYERYEPAIGHNWSETIKWSHTWYKNYPFIFAPEGSHDFSVTGHGTIEMSDYTNDYDFVRICPIGFYRVSDFVISDIKIRNYHGYAMMPFSCKNGLFKNIDIAVWCHGNGDGICLMNCQNIRITGCNMDTGDDAVYIFSSYRDPRRSEWWNSDEPQPSVNIEVDNCHLVTDCCKAFGMILWGLDCPDYEKIEVRNVYVHDNYFETLGIWNICPYTQSHEIHPVTGVRFENNTIAGIEENFFDSPISDMSGFPSMRQIQNGSFKKGRCFWQYDGKVTFDKENGCARLSENSEIYEGLWLSEKHCVLKIKTDGEACVFVREQGSGETVFEVAFHSGEKYYDFTPPHEGNYQIGIKSREAVCVYEVRLHGNHPGAGDYKEVVVDRGKTIYKY